MMVPAFALAALLLMPEPGQDGVSRARELYNMHDFDGAIEAAEAARRGRGAPEAATLILARARLERYRESQDVFDLAEGRSLLARIDTSRLSVRDRAEWLVGLGESLYLEGQYGAAAEIFDEALGSSGSVDAPTRERLLDWWASALDQRARGASSREATYLRILRRMEDELRVTTQPAAASYWLVVAAREAGDLDRAWDAAMAGWVRAPLAGVRADALRADLDRYVDQVLIPERARRGGAGEESARAAASLRADWETLKQRWRPAP